jgi:hypothetical protein
MVITVFASLDARLKNKCLARMRVSCPDAFSFDKCLDVLRSIYGSGIVIEFLCV